LIDVAELKVDGKNCLGLKVDLPDSPAPLVLITAEKGFVMCGLLDMQTAERLNVAAAMVSGVKSFDDVLNALVKSVTSRAKGLGVETGTKGSEALKHMS